MSTRGALKRKLQCCRGFTLIELLIVVAIISIMSAASLSIMTAPATEQVRATAEAHFEAGCATLFSRLSTDAHQSKSVTKDAGKLVFRGHQNVTYYVDAGKRLRRVVGTVVPQTEASPGAALLENVEELFAQQTDDGVWRIGVRCGLRSPGESQTVNREMSLCIGEKWIGS